LVLQHDDDNLITQSFLSADVIETYLSEVNLIEEEEKKQSV